MKDVRTKSRKIDPLPRCPCGLRTHHKFRKTPCFLGQKVRTSVSEDPLPLCPKNIRMDNPSPPDCGRLLWISYFIIKLASSFYTFSLRKTVRLN